MTSPACFIDTFALFAMLNPIDARHLEAMRWFDGSRQPLITTEWILMELADGLSAARTRATAVAINRRLRADTRVTIIASSGELFRRGFDLYANRGDKDWSLTDCISFIVMGDRGITDALTGDHHFEQAGFVSLLK
jgi:predicted nucleic acid-binding protein